MSAAEEDKDEKPADAPAISTGNESSNENEPDKKDSQTNTDDAEDEAEKRIQAKKESAALTARLQKLALEKQHLNKKDRLKVIQADTSSHLSSVKSFEELNLPKHLLDAIFSMGFDRPSAIQEEALPRILANPPRNLIGQAQAGSGKTAAFTLGMLYRIKIDSPATTQALCVTPTRELAIQIIDKAVKPLAANMDGLKITLAVAKVDLRGKIDAHLIVGTPGKVCDWLKRRQIDAKTIKVFVLDEADNLVEEGGHRANSLLIKKVMPRSCQSLFFSATFPPQVVEFATRMVHNPDKILIEDGPEFLVVDNIKQMWVDCRPYDGGKVQFLSDIYSLMTIGQSIVFVHTKKDADDIANTLSNSGFTCSVLHGNIEPQERDMVMQQFRDGKSNVLITTNVLARGVDVDTVSLVVNYDIPVDREGRADNETYLHRIGRTGRFGRKGNAINLIGNDTDIGNLAEIERHFSKDGKELIKQVDADPETLAEVIEI